MILRGSTGEKVGSAVTLQQFARQSMGRDPTGVKASVSSEAGDNDDNDLELGQQEHSVVRSSNQQSPDPPLLATTEDDTSNGKQQKGHGAIPLGPAGAWAQLGVLPDYKDQVRSVKSQEQLPRRRLVLPDFKDQVRPPPPSQRSEDSRSVGEDDDDDPSPSSAASRTLNNPQQEPQQRARDNSTYLVTAHLVVAENVPSQQQQERQSSVVVAEATPVLAMTVKRKVMIAAVVVVGIAAIVVVTAVVLSSSSSQSRGGSNSVQEQQGPTQAPSAAATELAARQWIETGNTDGGSGDELGAYVAISHNGLALAVSSPGVGGEGVLVYKRGPAGWEFVTPIRTEWGRSVALSDSGTILAIGQPIFRPEPEQANDDLASDPPLNTIGLQGTVAVYQIDFYSASPATDDDGFSLYGDRKGTHEQIGPAIISTVTDDLEFGGSLDLSADGSILIIASSINCSFQTLRYDSTANDWIPFGQGIACTDPPSAPENEEVFSVTLAQVGLSDDGLVAAIGKPTSAENNRRGTVAVYQFLGSFETGLWQLLGQPLLGTEDYDSFGASLSLSGDGTVVAVGAPRNNGGRGPTSSFDQNFEADTGACFVYRYNETTQEWLQLGSTILGENVGDLLGTSVSMNGNGNVVAVGAMQNNDNGDDSGHVRVLEFHSLSLEWVQVGEDIPGVFQQALSGSGVALSATGDTVVVGSPNNVAINSDQHGSVQVFETGIMPKKSGTVAFTVVIEFSLSDNAWMVERLDVEQPDTVFYANVPEDTYDDSFGNDDTIADEANTTTLMLDEGGVYRFLINHPFDYGEEFGRYKVFLGQDTSNLQNLIVDGRGNFTDTDYAEFSFLATSPSIASSPVGTTRRLTLSITFDDHPQDVHWVIISTIGEFDNGEEDGSGPSSRVDHRVVAFGPERQYGPELAGKTLEIPIDAPALPANSELKFIYSDTARNGLCCEVGKGAFSLSDQDGRLLFTGTSEGKRRDIFPFSL